MITYAIHKNGHVESHIDWNGSDWSGMLDTCLLPETGYAVIESDYEVDTDYGPQTVIYATASWSKGKLVLCRLPVSDEQTDIEVEAELLDTANRNRRQGCIVTIVDMRTPIPSFFNYAPITEGR